MRLVKAALYTPRKCRDFLRGCVRLALKRPRIKSYLRKSIEKSLARDLAPLRASSLVDGLYLRGSWTRPQDFEPFASDLDLAMVLKPQLTQQDLESIGDLWMELRRKNPLFRDPLALLVEKNQLSEMRRFASTLGLLSWQALEATQDPLQTRSLAPLFGADDVAGSFFLACRQMRFDSGGGRGPGPSNLRKLQSLRRRLKPDLPLMEGLEDALREMHRWSREIAPTPDAPTPFSSPFDDAGRLDSSLIKQFEESWPKISERMMAWTEGDAQYFVVFPDEIFEGPGPELGAVLESLSRFSRQIGRWCLPVSATWFAQLPQFGQWGLVSLRDPDSFRRSMVPKLFEAFMRMETFLISCELRFRVGQRDACLQSTRQRLEERVLRCQTYWRTGLWTRSPRPAEVCPSAFDLLKVHETSLQAAAERN